VNAVALVAVVEKRGIRSDRGRGDGTSERYLRVGPRLKWHFLVGDACQGLGSRVAPIQASGHHRVSPELRSLKQTCSFERGDAQSF